MLTVCNGCGYKKQNPGMDWPACFAPSPDKMLKCWELFSFWAFRKDEIYALVKLNPETGKMIVPEGDYEVKK
jgi:hypothetical protein